MTNITPRFETFKFVSFDDLLNNVEKIAPHQKRDATRQKQLKELCQQVFSNGANLAIVQRYVLDPDYMAEYLTYYAKQFQLRDRFCVRIHFFRLKSEDLSLLQSPESLDVIDFVGSSCSSEPETYQGFLTIRPIEACRVGVSVIRPSEAVGHVTCQDSFDVNIAGHKMLVKGTPFMQQDNAVGACSQTAIWVALRTVRKRHASAMQSPAQISESAWRVGGSLFSNTLPNREGLNVSQLVNVLHSNGYASHVVDLKRKAEPSPAGSVKQFLHPYVESGVPVILVLSRSGDSLMHAVVVVGHSNLISKQVNYGSPIFSTNSNSSKASIDFYHSSLWFEGLVVQNDSWGPYQHLGLNTSPSDPHGYSLNDAHYAIPVLSREIFMLAEEANAYFEKIIPRTINLTWLPEGSYKIAYRSYLMTKHEFRHWARNSKISPTLQKIYRTMVLPKHLWVCELSLADKYTLGVDQVEETRFGEIVLDASGDGDDGSLIAYHYNYRALGGTEGYAVCFSTFTGEFSGENYVLSDESSCRIWQKS